MENSENFGLQAQHKFTSFGSLICNALWKKNSVLSLAAGFGSRAVIVIYGGVMQLSRLLF